MTKYRDRTNDDLIEAQEFLYNSLKVFLKFAEKDILDELLEVERELTIREEQPWE